MVAAPRQLDLPEALGWAALAAITEAVAIKDSGLRYVWANDSLLTMFSIELDAIVGLTDDQLFVDGPLLPDPQAERAVLTCGRPDERYETLFFDDGRIREILLTTARVDADGETFLVCVLHDITEVTAANHSLVATTEHLVAESVELRALALRDPLTGLLNLRGFEAMTPPAFERVRHGGAVLMLDLDDFKPINDGYGHDVGDAVLRTVADALRECTRNDRDIIARIGGDEFVVAMPLLPEDEARVIVDRIRDFIAERPVLTGDKPFMPAVSIGLALRPPGSPLNLDDWRRCADESLYQAKRAGKDQAVITMLD